jgi:hypothetical protein
MAGDWIKVRVKLPGDPSVATMSKALGISVEAVVGHLIRVWGWATDHIVDGHADSVTPDIIDAEARLPGMAESMEKSGWIRFTSKGAIFPKWDRHLSQGAKARELATERKRQERHAPSVTKTRPEKRREESIDDDDEGSSFTDEQMRARIATLTRKPDWLPQGKPWVSEPAARKLARKANLTTEMLLAAERVARDGRNTLKNPAGAFLAEVHKALKGATQ